MKDYNSIIIVSRGKFGYAKFAKNSVEHHDENTNLLVSTHVSIIKTFNDKIIPIENQISTIIKEQNPRMLTIPGLSEMSAATILSEYGEIKNFSSSNKILAFARLEPSIIQSDTIENNGMMVKHGSSHLRYSPTFYDYYPKKRSEGKCHRVALSHVYKKLLRVIYTLEKSNPNFDPSLLK